jgi:hypothetical protein
MDKLINNSKKKNNSLFLILYIVIFLLFFSNSLVLAGDLDDSDTDGDGWVNNLEYSYGTSINNPESFPLDTDKDGIPDEDSPDGQFTGDTDDDNDGLIDIYEVFLGANSKDSSNVLLITIVETKYYLVDVEDDSLYNKICNPTTGFYNDVQYENNMILIDLNKDSSWDYIFNNGEILEYSILSNFNILNNFKSIWIILLIFFILLIIIIIILIKLDIIYFYEEEYIVEE